MSPVLLLSSFEKNPKPEKTAEGLCFCGGLLLDEPMPELCQEALRKAGLGAEALDRDGLCEPL